MRALPVMLEKEAIRNRPCFSAKRRLAEARMLRANVTKLFLRSTVAGYYILVVVHSLIFQPRKDTVEPLRRVKRYSGGNDEERAWARVCTRTSAPSAVFEARTLSRTPGD